MTTPLKTRIPSMYLEKGALKVSKSSIIWETEGTESDIPIERVACILLGPGSTVTHAAIRKCANANTLVQWVGEQGSSAYATSEPLTGDTKRLLNQSLVATNPKFRNRALNYLFKRRFGVSLAPELEAAAIRGMEGARVKPIYAKLAAEYNLNWQGRQTGDWDKADALNQVISIASGYLTQIATVSVLAAGFSPAIGFSHTGFNRAFSCDIADLYKFEVAVPTAFDLYSKNKRDHNSVRQTMRDKITEMGLIDRMIQDAEDVVNAGLGITSSHK